MSWCPDPPGRVESKYKLRLSLEIAGRSVSQFNKLAHAELIVVPRLTGGLHGPNLSPAVAGIAEATIASAAAVTSIDAFMTSLPVRYSGKPERWTADPLTPNKKNS